jgi:fatty-acyl-CoA synthase
MSPLSYVHGASSTPFLNTTIGRAFDLAAERYREREALVVRHQSIRWTYEELRERVDQCASGLLSLGLEPGDRVGIWSPNNAEWTVTQFATAKAGLVLVNINPAYRLSELEYALNKVGCRALVTASSFKSSDYIGMLRELAPELDDAEPGALQSEARPSALQSERFPSLEFVIHLGSHDERGMIRFGDLMEAGTGEDERRLSAIADTLQFDDAINIQFTSGTTGLPKGATLTHHNILNNGYFVGEVLKLTHEDRICIPVPLYHCFGMVLGNLSAITHGSTMVYPSEGFEPEAVLAVVSEERCTTLYGVPTMFIAELEHPEFGSYDLSSLRTGIMAGSLCPIEVMKRVTGEMHMPEVGIAYGMTETSPASFQTAPDDPLDRRVATVGRVHPHVEVKVIDDDGRIVPCGQPGELLTRGYLVMLGYWGDEERTAEAVDAAGWMHTGDLATIDAEGYCSIVGRIKDMIIRGGENVYPREIEEFLYGHPDIEDVQVIGVPDERFGEQLCAWIKLRDGTSATTEQIQDFCKGQIAHFKIPHYVKFVDSFPMTVTGKIQKFVMREQMIQELELLEEQTA